MKTWMWIAGLGGAGLAAYYLLSGSSSVKKTAITGRPTTNALFPASGKSEDVVGLPSDGGIVEQGISLVVPFAQSAIDSWL
jgi:hypothetical protein